MASQEKCHRDRWSRVKNENKIQHGAKIIKLKPRGSHLDSVHSEICFINLGQMSLQKSWLLPPEAIKQSAYVSSLWPPAWTWVMTMMKRLSWTTSAFPWTECCTGRGAVDVALFSSTWSWEASHPAGIHPLRNLCLESIRNISMGAWIELIRTILLQLLLNPWQVCLISRTISFTCTTHILMSKQ